MSLIEKPRIPLLQMLTVGLLPSFFKVLWYRVHGAKIGKNVSIGPFTVLIADKLEIGDGTSIGFATIIRGREVIIRRHVRIGSMTFLDVERIFIDDDAKINEQVFAGGPMSPESYLHLGKNTTVMQYTFLNPTKPIIVGDGTGIGGHCLLFTHGSWQSQLDGYSVTFAPITLGKNVWLPWRVFVLPGVTVGDGATIVADSLVARDVPSSSIAGGVPARVLRGPDTFPKQMSENEKRRVLLEILTDFNRYLEYHGYTVSRDEIGAGTSMTINGKNGHKSVLLVFDRAPVTQSDIQFHASDCCVLALFGITADVKKNAQILWADIANQSRTGTSRIGEETLAFLLRFGLRFYRRD